MTARDTLIEFYHDFFNNYLTAEKFGEHNGLTPEQAKAFLELAKQVENSKHPEA